MDYLYLLFRLLVGTVGYLITTALIYWGVR